MTRLVECVPNFSEGRDPAVIDAIAGRISGTPGVHLLDRTSDRDHNRSVLTFAGDAAAVTDAMEGAVEEALARIDMRAHEGQHPRVGAVDVIPFVPLGETTMDECVALARDVRGARRRRALTCPSTCTRALQSAQIGKFWRTFDGLSSRVCADLISTPDYTPDFGPARLHPTGGAVVDWRPALPHRLQHQPGVPRSGPGQGDCQVRA